MKKTLIIDVICPQCKAKDNEVEIEITEHGYDGSYFSPGHGCQWTVIKNQECEHCKHKFTDDDLEPYEVEIQMRYSEPSDPL